MVVKRGLAELTKEERNTDVCKNLIKGRLILNYVFPESKYICGGCGEVRRGGRSMRLFCMPEKVDAFFFAMVGR
jgi:hypothetical protein